MRFSDFGKRVVFAAFDGGEITSDAGVLLLREQARRIRLFERMAGYFHRSPAIENDLGRSIPFPPCWLNGFAGWRSAMKTSSTTTRMWTPPAVQEGIRTTRDMRSGTVVCGRPLQCKKEFEQLVTCGQVLSYVRPLKCGMHAPRALMVFVDRIQIAPAVCLTALRVVLVFPTPSL